VQYDILTFIENQFTSSVSILGHFPFNSLQLLESTLLYNFNCEDLSGWRS